MLRELRCAVLLLSAIYLTGEPLPGQGLLQGDDQKKDYKLSGTVINSVTAKPIPRVLVRLVLTPERAVLTGPQGDFEFDHLNRGTIQAIISKPGFFPPGTKDNYYYQVPLQVGPDAAKVVLKLEPEAVITGRVTAQDDEPLEDTYINVLKSQAVATGRELVTVRSAAVDEDGSFRIAGLQQGRYYVSVRARRVFRSILGRRSANVDQTYPAVTYFPSATDASSATPLDLAPGQTVDLQFALKLVPSFKLSGAIANARDWKQLNPPLIVDDFQQVLFPPDRSDGQTGAFEFRAVPAGNYLLQFGGTDAEGRYIPFFQRVNVQSNITGLRVSLPRGIDIPVVVRSEYSKGQHVRGQCSHYSGSGKVETSDCSDYPEVRLELHALDFHQQITSDQGPLKGPLGIHGVTPGRYILRASPSFGGYIQAVHCGTLDLLREPLVVREGDATPAIEVVLRDDSGSLRIQVHAETPGQQGLLLVFPDPMTLEPQIRITAQGGEYTTGPVPPGAYKVFVFDALDYPDPETLAKYASRASSVTVAPNQSATVVVDFIRTGE